MSLKTIIAEKTTGRRGRPRKYPIDTTKKKEEITSSPISEEKPREERSYKDFFPDLDIKEPLSIVKSTSLFDSSPDLSSTEEDSNNKNSTTSANEAITTRESTSTKLPTPSFQKLNKKDLEDRFKNKQDKSQDYKDLHSFHRPENHYIRYTGKNPLTTIE